MSFPITDREITEKVRGRALVTRMARRIASKADLRVGSGTSTGRPPTTILRTVKWTTEIGPPPFGEIQFSGVSRRRLGQGISNRTTVSIAGIQEITRFWIEGFTEVRIVARVFEAQAGGHLLCGFAHPTFDALNFLATARLPDTYALLGTGLQLVPPPTSAIVMPMVAPYTISPWVPIHENFLNTEVQCAFYLRNLNTSGLIVADVGACDIQVR